jgi:rhodanese-related sulfurtransferase/mannose-6-phosphate isomerase-like protein (cupin superfamily)
MTTSTGVTARTRTLTELASLVRSTSGRPPDWIERVRLRSGERWFECLEQGLDFDLWLISWLPGHGTGFHDHGQSSGAFAVAMGALEEHRAGADPMTVGCGQVRTFGPRYVHDVRNASDAPAISIHAYSPPLTEMNRYQLAGDDLVRLRVGQDAPDWRATTRPRGSRTIEEILGAARGRLTRLSPGEAHAAAGAGAVLVDIRPAAQRALEGEIPNGLIVDRNVLEWRFDPLSDARLPEVSGYDLQVIIFCSEGYTSSLAAAALHDIGLSRATDVIGGFRAWRAAGLPTVGRAERLETVLEHPVS